jgi:hypothetical protein
MKLAVSPASTSTLGDIFSCFVSSGKSVCSWCSRTARADPKLGPPCDRSVPPRVLSQDLAAECLVFQSEPLCLIPSSTLPAARRPPDRRVRVASAQNEVARPRGVPPKSPPPASRRPSAGRGSPPSAREAEARVCVRCVPSPGRCSSQHRVNGHSDFPSCGHRTFPTLG